MARPGHSSLDGVHPQRGHPLVVAGVAGDSSDESTLDAATALARSVLGEVRSLHVEPDADGVTHADLELIRASDALGAAFVVIGKRSGPVQRGRGAPGTTTRGLLAEPHRPLWLQRGAWSPPERILAAIEDPERDRGVLARAHDLCARFHACLVAVHCQETGRPAESSRDRGWFERWVEERLGEPRAAEVQVIHLVGPPVRALAEPIDRADLAVLGRGCRQGLGRVLHEAVSSRRGPLLVVPVSA